MAAKVRSLSGCWTCRLRRKKCDEKQPICDGCAALEISCLYSDVKPEWMDGGEKQRIEAENLKAEVKRMASARRERKYLHGLEMDLGDLSVVTADAADSDEDMSAEVGAPRQGTEMTSGRSSANSGNQTSPMVTSTAMSTPASSTASGGSLCPNASRTNEDGASLEYFEEELDLSMMTVYLDYVFPFLYPFYRPPLRDGGRGWLLVLLNRNKALKHTALSVASHFFSEIMTITSAPAEVAERSECRISSALELQRHQELGFREMQKQLHSITARGVPNTPVAESARVLQSIIQLLEFEVAMNNSGDWRMHLDACTALFDDILNAHAMTDGYHCWFLLQAKLGMSGPLYKLMERRYRQHHTDFHLPEAEATFSIPDAQTAYQTEQAAQRDFRPLNSDQAAMRFFTALLLQIDIMASTGLDTPPKLEKYHGSLLKSYEVPDPTQPNHTLEMAPAIILPPILGLKNDLLLSIAAISALDSWKKSQRRVGSLSTIELVTRAAAIETDLRNQMATYTLANSGIFIPGNGDGPAPCSDFNHPLDPLTSYSAQALLLGNSPGGRDEASDTLSLLWAQAALTYLSVVVSGWQPSNPQTRASVLNSIDLFRRNRVPACLRMAVWPFVVTGCMALPGEEEEIFRELVRGMGGLAAFGTIKEALAIMENVWSRRAEIETNPERWDLQSCLNVLGRTSLLI
jgi:C6 transcription factor Pro1